MARPEKNYPKKTLLKVIEGSNGIVTAIARQLGCNWHCAERNIKRFPETMQAFNDEKEKLLDFAESQAITAMKQGDGAMIRYYLSTIGKKRGYTLEETNEETTADDGQDVNIIMDAPDAEPCEVTSEYKDQ